MCSKFDTIYSVNKTGVRADYTLDFGDKTLPKNVRSLPLNQQLSSEYNGYVHGVQQMLETGGKLVFQFNYGSLPPFSVDAMKKELAKDPKKAKAYIQSRNASISYHAFYDKKTGQSFVANGISIKHFGQNGIDFHFYDRPYIMSCVMPHPSEFKDGKNVNMLSIPENRRFEKAVNVAKSKQTEESNPMVIIFKFKN